MIPGIVDSAVAAARSFTDEFPGDGALESRWSNTRGTWTKVSGDAVTSTAVSSYPLLSFNANTQRASVRAEGGTTNTFGWGASFWVVDANNWWAVVADRITYTGVVGTTFVYPCGTDPVTGIGDCGGGCSTCACYVCATNEFRGYPTATPQDQYGPRYLYTLRLIKSVGGSITTEATSTIIDDVSASLTIGYVQAVVNASGQITATAQMSTGGAVAQIQTTPASPSRGRRYGIIAIPATNGTQSTGLERFVYAPV